MRITPLVLTGALVATGFAGEASAAKKKPKPITKTYEATAPAPDFTNLAGDGYSVCRMTVPQSWHSHTFKAPAAGKIKVDMSEFLGDWDMLFLDSRGTAMAEADALEQSTPNAPKTETMTVKIKKAGSYRIIACNWAGGSTATVKYVFTYA